MKKALTVTLAITSIILGGIVSFNFWLYDAPTPCFGKKTDWTQTEIEEYFMMRVHGNTKRYGHVSYESFREHPGTVLVFSDDWPAHNDKLMKGRYILGAWFEVLEGDKTGIIEEQAESYSKCLRLSGRLSRRFDPTKDNYKTDFYLDLVDKKKQSK